MAAYFLLAASFFWSGAFAVRKLHINTQSSAAAAAKQSTNSVADIKVKMWTWNSLKDDLRNEVRNIFETDADLIVTCQTEAIKAVYEWAPDSRSESSEWWHLAHAQHAGVAGGNRNNQFLDVFLRKSPNNRNATFTMPPKDDWNANSGWTLRGTDLATKKVSVQGVVDAVTRVHQTSNTGKGGASSVLRFAATNYREETTLGFLCAHLDAFEDAKRMKGLVKMFDQINEQIEAIGHQSGGLRLPREVLEVAPCAVFDSDSDDCMEHIKEAAFSEKISEKKRIEATKWVDAQETSAKKRPKVDSIFLLGDLNYRLLKMESIFEKTFDIYDPELMANALVTPEGRQHLAAYDPLIASSQTPAQLVQKVEDGGFGFTCNEPFQSYPPTYKLFNEGDCAQLGRMLNSAQHNLRDAQRLAWECYTKKPGSSRKPKPRQWDLKGDKLQLGWLDRFCVRTGYDSVAKHKFVKEEGWTTVEGSDHMAAAVEMVISNPSSCDVELVNWPEHHFKKGPRDAVTKGEGMDFGCVEGYRMVEVDADGKEIISGFRFPASIRLICDGDLKLVVEGQENTDFSRIQCKRFCGPYHAPEESGPVVAKSVKGTADMEGSRVEFSCSVGHTRFGSASADCMADGTYKYTRKVPPHCAYFCPTEELTEYVQQHGLELKSETSVKDPFDMKLYANEVKQLEPSFDRKWALKGTQFELGCTRPGAVLLGNPKLLCDTVMHFAMDMQKISCASSARFRVQEIDLLNYIPPSEVKYFKVALYKRGDDIEQKHGYQSQVKFKTSEMGSPKAELTTTTKLSDTFVYVRVCTKKSHTIQAFSTCRVGAHSLAPLDCPDCNMASILQRAGGGLEQVTLSLNLNFESPYAQGSQDANEIRDLTSKFSPDKKEWKSDNGHSYLCCCQSAETTDPSIKCELVDTKTTPVYKYKSGCGGLKGDGFHSWSSMATISKYSSFKNVGKCVVPRNQEKATLTLQFLTTDDGELLPLS